MTGPRAMGSASPVSRHTCAYPYKSYGETLDGGTVLRNSDLAARVCEGRKGAGARSPKVILVSDQNGPKIKV